MRPVRQFDYDESVVGYG
ncbi:hypothetical protein TSMEX_003266 [Taenia solium]|eukprot:TsM_001210300 transcript=TsM_001210300 gene=TsM_001210300